MARILLIEDNEENRDMLERRLVKMGFSVHCAMDGQSGVELARAGEFELILMDMSLPVLDGWEATRRLKNDPATRGIPVLGLSAHAMDSDRRRALEAGCDDYDTKPVDFQRLLHKIQLLLAQGRVHG